MSELKKGTIRKWNDDRGFGFIQPDGGGPDVFAHISAFEISDGRRPNESEPVLYTIDENARRPRATTVRSAARQRPKPSYFATAFALVAIAVFLAWIWGIVPFGPIFGAYLGMSILTYAFYYVDKRRAETNRWRITETSLHVMEALGGWPGALVAQLALRHKTQKPDYQRVYWAIVAVHAAFGIYWALSLPKH
ncbi:MAG: uncharacterized membrane protein YsdA (DUF1294 family)/cold shock CspA family protein [Hyphomicrobiaceae bacterium]|jgi:uncharacterized membrane protein YsdA (DUF1294 family)/cold shock CspA family protein